MSQRAKLENGKLQIFVNGDWRPVQLDDYKDLCWIGEGANGVVISGKNKKLDRKEAIKVYIPNYKSRTGRVSREQFLKEIKKLAKLKNPNIVTVYSAFESGEDIHCVTMEYIEGITLSKWLSQRYYIDELDRKIKSVQLVKQILETVSFYQERGIIHGDLHTNNIMVSGVPRDSVVNIHIFDFGTSHFSKSGQSNQRENFFVYDLTRRVLGKYFNEKYFTVTGVQNIKDGQVKNDVRDKYPLLVTKTMLAYVQMLDKLLQVEFMDLDKHYERVVPAVVALAKGVYINNTYAVNSMYTAFGQKIPLEVLCKIMKANMEERCYPSVITDYIKYEKRYTDSFEIYFQMAMETRNCWDITKAKEFTFQHVGKTLAEEEYDAYMTDICKTVKESYADLEKTGNWNADDWRMIVFDALVVYLGYIEFLQEYWIRLNEYECRRRRRKCQ